MATKKKKKTPSTIKIQAPARGGGGPTEIFVAPLIYQTRISKECEPLFIVMILLRAEL